jgi:hypothetical protein
MVPDVLVHHGHLILSPWACGEGEEHDGGGDIGQGSCLSCAGWEAERTEKKINFLKS